MAIYHLNAKTGSRSAGQSAGAKARYHRREGRYARGRLSADQVVHASAGNMPAWASEPTDYWDAADTNERANGRLFKEVEFALPRELDAGAQAELADAFAAEIAGDELPYQLVVHDDPGGENPHAHLMVSERVNDGIERDPATWFKRASNKDPAAGGARKSDRLKPKAWLEQTRERWAEVANDALARADQPDRIDHRSLAQQGIEQLPGRHLGPHAAAAEARGVRTQRGERHRARDRQRAPARTAGAAPGGPGTWTSTGTGETGHGHATAPAQEAAATTGDTTTPDQARPGRPSEGDPVAAARAHVHDLEQRARQAPPGVGKDQAKKQALREIAPEFATHERAYREAQQRQEAAQRRYKDAQKAHQRYEGIRGLVRAIRHPVRQRQAALQLERAADAADSADEALEVEQRERKRWKEWMREPENRERIDARADEIRDGIEARSELPAARQRLTELKREHSPGHEPQHEHEKGPRMKM